MGGIDLFLLMLSMGFAMSFVFLFGWMKEEIVRSIVGGGEVVAACAGKSGGLRW